MFQSELPQFLKNTTRILLLIEKIDNMCLHFSSLYLFYGHFSSTLRYFLFEILHNLMFPIWNANTRHAEKEVEGEKRSNNISSTAMSVVPINYMNFPSALAKYVNSCILREDNLMQSTETVKQLVISCH